MPRPRTPLSSYGTINLSELQPGKWRARTRYRFMDGKSRQIERFGATSKKAEIALKTALVGIEADAGGELKPSTRLSDLAQRFLVAKRDAGRAEGSLATYGSAIKMHISPKIGDLSVTLRGSRSGRRGLPRPFHWRNSRASWNGCAQIRSWLPQTQ